jgi:2'-5' RNA ligase
LIRAFIAIEIPEEILKELATIQDRLRKTGASVSWVKPGNIHLTLKFLGNIETGLIEPVLREMELIGRQMEPFSLEVSGIGCFPNMKNPRVIWVGIEDRDQRVVKLQSTLESSLESIGFSREKRNFTPHLTIGRIKISHGKGVLLDEVRKIGNPFLGSIEVKEMVLFQSDLHPQGAIYTPIGRARFSSGNNYPGSAGGRDEHR